MAEKLSRDELVQLVNKIANVDGTEEEIDQMLATLEANVIDPNVSDLMFYSDEELSPEEIVDRALAYKPTLL